MATITAHQMCLEGFNAINSFTATITQFPVWKTELDNRQGGAGEYIPLGSAYPSAPRFNPKPRGIVAEATCVDYTTSVFYGRIHVIPSFIDAGNLFSIQTYDVEVWNAFFISKTLSSIDKTNAEGINILGTKTPGSVFNAIESYVYQTEITVEGPPTIDALIKWVFGGPYGQLSITGNRVVLFSMRPDSPFIENLEWFTNIIESFEKEQRIRLRKKARQNFEVTCSMIHAEQSRMNAIAHGWAYKVFGIPVWIEETQTTTAITAGVLEINIDTTASDFRIDGLAIIWTSDIINEMVEIQTIEPTKLVLKRAVINNYPEGATIAPLRTSSLYDGIKSNIGRGDYTKNKMIFRIKDNIELSSSPEHTHNSLELIRDYNILLKPIPAHIYHPVEHLDNQTGAIVSVITKKEITNLYQITFYAEGATEVWRLRKLLHRMKGSLIPFYLLIRRNDYILTETVGATDTSITVQLVNQKYYDELGIFRHIWVRLKDGTEFFKIIDSGTEQTVTTDVILLTSSFGQEIQPDDVEYFSILKKVRFNTDKIKITHRSGRTAEATIPIKILE